MQMQNHCSVALRTIYIAPGAILSKAEFFTSQSQVNSNPVALRRLGTGKVAQTRCARFRM